MRDNAKSHGPSILSGNVCRDHLRQRFSFPRSKGNRRLLGVHALPIALPSGLRGSKMNLDTIFKKM